MKTSILSLAVLLAALAAPQAQAHTDSTQYVPFEWRCYAIPRVLRKQATNQQIFEFSNTGIWDLRFYIFANDFYGTLIGNLVRAVRGGDIAPGQIVQITNTALQRSNTNTRDEESAEVCFARENFSGEPGSYAIGASVVAREHRRSGSAWSIVDLQHHDTWWSVSARATATSASAPVTASKRRLLQIKD